MTVGQAASTEPEHGPNPRSGAPYRLLALFDRPVTPCQRLRWTGTEGRFAPVEEPGQTAIADSWLVADGQVRGFTAHTRRFSASCAELFGVEATRTREFMQAVCSRLPARGRWFPRVELVLAAGTPQFQLWVRPAPPRGRAVRLWLPEGPDLRTRPRTKGPDLEWLAWQHAAAQAAGADEAVLLTRSGRVLEGATTSILWWHGDELCAPPEDAGVLPGVTRLILLDLAAFIGAPITFRCPEPAELAGREVWAVNALHGIRPVTGWVGVDIEPGPVLRAGRWQRYLDEFAVPIRNEGSAEPAIADSAIPAPSA
jgi:branched-subunit amino acid aminotransferase/4-amino-4-deoxychorismate lyase